MLSEIAKNLRAVTQTLQASVRMLKVKVHDSAIRKRLSKYGLSERRRLLLSKKNMAPQLRFSKLHLNKPRGFWYNVL